MLRWLRRLIVFALIAAAVGYVIMRFLGQDEDFDDFDDIDTGFDFQETPVEIDVVTAEQDTASASETAGGGAESSAATASPDMGGESTGDQPGSYETARLSSTGSGPSTTTLSGSDAATAEEETEDLTEIKGIGPAYEARLEAIGIDSFEDLTAADPGQLAEQLGVIGGAKEVEEWIEQARDILSNNGEGSGTQTTPRLEGEAGADSSQGGGE